MDTNLQYLIDQMTLEEKASLCSGMDFWHTKPIERLGIPSVMMTDGPHGLRQIKDPQNQIDIGRSEPATCFPTASTTSCSFDCDLLYELGRSIGEEMLQENISIVLGPGVNIKRSPLCGRNFEYFSEDPLLAGELSAAMISGVQSLGLGTSLKHFVANNQETARMINDSIVDERTLREIYLLPFEIAVKKGKPWTIMCSYNKVNGIYMCQNKALLTDITRSEWGFEGLFITDWGAMDDRLCALKAGLDLEMPYSGPTRDNQIVSAIKSGALSEIVLNETVLRLLKIFKKSQANDCFGEPYNITAHDSLARKFASASAVLLKNSQILPLKENTSLAVIGEFAKTPRYQGAGSSKINPHKLTGALESFDALGVDYEFACGYDLTGRADPSVLIQSAVDIAVRKDIVLVFAGLPDSYESEGFDRTHIDLPKEQNDLIHKLAAVNPNIVVILHAGSSMRMPWLDQVKAVLLMGLGGQCVGAATVDLLLGMVNPSGKLSETYPLALNDNPAYRYFGHRLNTEYRESIFVGYRYYEKAGKNVLFPFGFGLSYTNFEFKDLKLSHSVMQDDQILELTLKVKNTGIYDGKEVIQVYIAPPPSSIYKPVKELRAFKKILLKVGEEEEVTFKLGKRAFAYWNVNLKDWHVESGAYQVLVGNSSKDIHLQAEIAIQSTQPTAIVPDYTAIAPGYYNLAADPLEIPVDQFETVLGAKISRNEDGQPFTVNSTLSDAQKTFIGRQLFKIFTKRMDNVSRLDDGQDETMQRMVMAMVMDMPFRSFSMAGLSHPMIQSLVDLLNNKILKGLVGLRKSRRSLKDSQSS